MIKVVKKSYCRFTTPLHRHGALGAKEVRSVRHQLSIDRMSQPRARQDGGSGYDAAPERTISSEDLFRGSREIAIRHGEAFYRLKITRQDKLILNK